MNVGALGERLRPSAKTKPKSEKFPRFSHSNHNLGGEGLFGMSHAFAPLTFNFAYRPDRRRSRRVCQSVRHSQTSKSPAGLRRDSE